jgi:hypothetical protein
MKTLLIILSFLTLGCTTSKKSKFSENNNVNLKVVHVIVKNNIKNIESNIKYSQKTQKIKSNLF